MTGMQGLVIPNLLSITTEFLSVNWLDVMDFTEGSNVGLAGCGMKLKPEAGCGIWKILKVRREMKIGRDVLCFESEIGDRTCIGVIIIQLKLRVTREIKKYQFALEMGLIDAPV